MKIRTMTMQGDDGRTAEFHRFIAEDGVSILRVVLVNPQVEGCLKLSKRMFGGPDVMSMANDACSFLSDSHQPFPRLGSIPNGIHCFCLDILKRGKWQGCASTLVGDVPLAEEVPTPAVPAAAGSLDQESVSTKADRAQVAAAGRRILEQEAAELEAVAAALPRAVISGPGFTTFHCFVDQPGDIREPVTVDAEGVFHDADGRTITFKPVADEKPEPVETQEPVVRTSNSYRDSHGQLRIPDFFFEPVGIVGLRVENQLELDSRLPKFLKMHANKRFLSVTPTTCIMDISRFLLSDYDRAVEDFGEACETNKLDAVICWEEQPCTSRVRRHCNSAKVPFFCYESDADFSGDRVMYVKSVCARLGWTAEPADEPMITRKQDPNAKPGPKLEAADVDAMLKEWAASDKPLELVKVERLSPAVDAVPEVEIERCLHCCGFMQWDAVGPFDEDGMMYTLYCTQCNVSRSYIPGMSMAVCAHAYNRTAVQYRSELTTAVELLGRHMMGQIVKDLDKKYTICTHPDSHPRSKPQPKADGGREQPKRCYKCGAPMKIDCDDGCVTTHDEVLGEVSRQYPGLTYWLECGNCDNKFDGLPGMRLDDVVYLYNYTAEHHSEQGLAEAIGKLKAMADKTPDPFNPQHRDKRTSSPHKMPIVGTPGDVEKCWKCGGEMAFALREVDGTGEPTVFCQADECNIEIHYPTEWSMSQCFDHYNHTAKCKRAETPAEVSHVWKIEFDPSDVGKPVWCGDPCEKCGCTYFVHLGLYGQFARCMGCGRKVVLDSMPSALSPEPSAPVVRFSEGRAFWGVLLVVGAVLLMAGGGIAWVLFEIMGLLKGSI